MECNRLKNSKENFTLRDQCKVKDWSTMREKKSLMLKSVFFIARKKLLDNIWPSPWIKMKLSIISYGNTTNQAMTLKLLQLSRPAKHKVLKKEFDWLGWLSFATCNFLSSVCSDEQCDLSTYFSVGLVFAWVVEWSVVSQSEFPTPTQILERSRISGMIENSFGLSRISQSEFS